MVESSTRVTEEQLLKGSRSLRTTVYGGLPKFARNEWGKRPEEHFPSSLALAQLSQQAYYDENASKPVQLPEGWTCLMVGETDPSDIANNYRGKAFFNDEKRQLVIAHKGTALTIGDIYTDIVGVLLERYVPEIGSAIRFVDEVLQRLVRSSPEECFSISITGHSLGGWLAQITAFTGTYLSLKDGTDLELERRPVTDLPHLHVVAFDSPGCRTMIQRIALAFNCKERDDLIKNLDINNCLAYPPTLVSTLKEHIGFVYCIDTKTASHLKMGVNNHGIEEIITAIKMKSTRYLVYCLGKITEENWTNKRIFTKFLQLCASEYRNRVCVSSAAALVAYCAYKKKLIYVAGLTVALPLLHAATDRLYLKRVLEKTEGPAHIFDTDQLEFLEVLRKGDIDKRRSLFPEVDDRLRELSGTGLNKFLPKFNIFSAAPSTMMSSLDNFLSLLNTNITLFKTDTGDYPSFVRNIYHLFYYVPRIREHIRRRKLPAAIRESTFEPQRDLNFDDELKLIQKLENQNLVHLRSSPLETFRVMHVLTNKMPRDRRSLSRICINLEKLLEKYPGSLVKRKPEEATRESSGNTVPSVLIDLGAIKEAFVVLDCTQKVESRLPVSLLITGNKKIVVVSRKSAGLLVRYDQGSQILHIYKERTEQPNENEMIADSVPLKDNLHKKEIVLQTGPPLELLRFVDQAALEHYTFCGVEEILCKDRICVGSWSVPCPQISINVHLELTEEDKRNILQYFGTDRISFLEDNDVSEFKELTFWGTKNRGVWKFSKADVYIARKLEVGSPKQEGAAQIKPLSEEEFVERMGKNHVILEGPPSSGKTSCLMKLAVVLKKKFVESWIFFVEKRNDESIQNLARIIENKDEALQEVTKFLLDQHSSDFEESMLMYMLTKTGNVHVIFDGTETSSFKLLEFFRAHTNAKLWVSTETSTKELEKLLELEAPVKLVPLEDDEITKLCCNIWKAKHDFFGSYEENANQLRRLLGESDLLKNPLQMTLMCELHHPSSLQFSTFLNEHKNFLREKIKLNFGQKLVEADPDGSRRQYIYERAMEDGVKSAYSINGKCMMPQDVSELRRCGILRKTGIHHQFMCASVVDFFLVLPLVETRFVKTVPSSIRYDILMSDTLISEKRRMSRLFLDERVKDLEKNLNLKKYFERFGKEWREEKYLNSQNQTALHVLVKENRKNLLKLLVDYHDVLPKEFYLHKDARKESMWDAAARLERKEMIHVLSEYLPKDLKESLEPSRGISEETKNFIVAACLVPKMFDATEDLMEACDKGVSGDERRRMADKVVRLNNEFRSRTGGQHDVDILEEDITAKKEEEFPEPTHDDADLSISADQSIKVK